MDYKIKQDTIIANELSEKIEGKKNSIAELDKVEKSQGIAGQARNDVNGVS